MGNPVRGQSKALIALLLATLWYAPAAGESPPGPSEPSSPLDSTSGLPSAVPPPGPLTPLPSEVLSPTQGGRAAIAPEPVQSPPPIGMDFSIPPSRSPWYGSLDAIALRRVVQPNNSFAVATIGESGPMVLSTQDLDFDFTFGGRAMVGYMFSPCFSVEAVYFTTGTWTDTQSVNYQTPNAIGGFGNLFSPFSNFGNPPINGLDYDSSVSIHNQSNLQNFELNLRWDVPVYQSLAVSLLAGARCLQIPDRFDYSAQSATLDSAVEVRTRNDAMGVQIGSMFELAVTERFLCDFQIKAGILNDWAHQATDFTLGPPGSPPSNSFEIGRSATSYLTDIDLTFLYRWTPHLTTRVGYQALWVWDVALATENFTSNLNTLELGPARLNHSGSVLYHGPYAGIMLNW